MSAPPRRPAPFTELRDEEAILNFIFSPAHTFIGAVPPPAVASASAPASASSAAPVSSTVAQQEQAGLPAGCAGPSTARSADDAVMEAEHAGWTAREMAAVDAAEAGRLDDARSMLEDVISHAPARASAFNNRAQVRRMQGDVAGAREDLDLAIEKAHAWLDAHSAEGASAATMQLIEFHRSVLQHAYTHRAVCHHDAGDKTAEERDLHAAAAFGSRIAQMMTSGSNPYATLCSDTVALMLEGAKSGTASDAGTSEATK